MSILFIIYTLTIRPLTLFFEFLLSVSYQLISAPFPALVLFSLVVNLITLPLYNQADRLQSKARAKEKEIRPMADNIKQNFSGDEKIMMLQTYYRYMDYSPLTSLSSSISLILQIPFFIAAYQVLSSSMALKGTSLGLISDLGAPDGILAIGSFTINLLPIIMTLVNVVSSYIYSKDMDNKTKIQLYLTAIVFLVLLYNSPSGLVIYWLCNNVFSLFKNIVTKLLPIKKKEAKTTKTTKPKQANETIIFILYALCTSVLIGLLIPSDMVSRSVGDFLSNYRTISMTDYLMTSFMLSLGFFVVWGGIFYFILANKKLTAGVMVSIAVCALLNYFAFYRNDGDKNRYLYIRTYFGSDFNDKLFNIVILVLTVLLVCILMKNKSVIFKYIAIPTLIAITFVSCSNMKKIYDENKSYSYIENQRAYPEITLSAEGQNVVIIMLDRAVGRVTPFIMEELPDLYEKFDGFTYYYNSLSFGRATNMGLPSIFGGYEYTPEAMNARDDISLRDKHDESLRVLPVLFGEQGYDVTVMDPAYAGYMFIPDLSIYDEYPYVDSYISNDIMYPYYEDAMDDYLSVLERNLFCFGLNLASPIAIRETLYDDGYYNDLNRRLSNNTYFQNMSDMSHASGIDYGFISPYSVLENLSSITSITDDNSTGSFVMFCNTATHEPMLLSEPDYSVSRVVDNEEYDADNWDRFTGSDMSLQILNPEMMGQYQIQAASFEALGSWFDYLREQGVYDNTRIIIVSDHGASSYMFGTEYVVDSRLNLCSINCLVMVKDFGATGFTTSNEFMVNAETPVIATNGLIDNPVNPFTGNPITSQLDSASDNMYFISEIHSVTVNNGNQFLPGSWFTYDPSSGDILDMSAWTYQGDY